MTSLYVPSRGAHAGIQFVAKQTCSGSIMYIQVVINE